MRKNAAGRTQKKTGLKTGSDGGMEGRKDFKKIRTDTMGSKRDLGPLILEASAFNRMERTNSTSLPGTHLTLNIPGSLILTI